MEKLTVIGTDKLRADLGQSPAAVSPPPEPQGFGQPQPPPPPSISPRGRPRDNIADRPIALAAGTPTPMSLQPAGGHSDAWRVGDSPSPTPTDDTAVAGLGSFSTADTTGTSDAQGPWCLPEPPADLDLEGVDLPF